MSIQQLIHTWHTPGLKLHMYVTWWQLNHGHGVQPSSKEDHEMKLKAPLDHLVSVIKHYYAYTLYEDTDDVAVTTKLMDKKKDIVPECSPPITKTTNIHRVFVTNEMCKCRNQFCCHEYCTARLKTECNLKLDSSSCSECRLCMAKGPRLLYWGLIRPFGLIHGCFQHSLTWQHKRKDGDEAPKDKYSSRQRSCSLKVLS